MHNPPPTKITVLISGNGSNLQALIDASTTTMPHARIAHEKYDADLAKLAIADSPDLVVCVGWMHILAPSFLDPLSAEEIPIINLHPRFLGYTMVEVDRGTSIIVREIPCKKEETLDELEERIHAQEHQLIVEGTAIAIIKL
ncbi:formyl transferase [Bisporella sp. PMI_857]|nr:formyl transferase [Bisporella sp. PMI_857]